jgi:hypothetical protein
MDRGGASCRFNRLPAWAEGREGERERGRMCFFFSRLAYCLLFKLLY